MCNLLWTHSVVVSPSLPPCLLPSFPPCLPASLLPPLPPGRERERCMDIYVTNEIYLQNSITGILILVRRRLLTDKYTVYVMTMTPVVITPTCNLYLHNRSCWTDAAETSRRYISWIGQAPDGILPVGLSSCQCHLLLDGVIKLRRYQRRATTGFGSTHRWTTGDTRPEQGEI